ncbi:MAG: hypothetical protein AAF063_16525 [Cyanobacteria bacterium J06643_5]
MTLVGAYIPDSPDISLGERRGFDNTDTNDKGILFQANVEQVVQELSKREILHEWKKDIYEREVIISEYFGWVIYQLKNHHWCVIQQNTSIIRDAYFEIHHAKVLSDWLQTKCIYYLFSDTSNTLVYQIYDKGQCQERCYFNPNDTREYQEVESALNDLVFTPQETLEGEFEELPVLFQSKIRLIPNKYFNPWDYIDIWLAEQGAYIPTIRWGANPRLRPGERHIISIRGLSRQQVRMDYVTLNSGWKKAFTTEK